MAFKAVLLGRQKLVSAMVRYRRTAERGLGAALIDEGRAIVRASRPFIPVDTGNLHDSGAVSDTPSHRGSQVFVVAGFGGPAGFGNVDGLTNTPGRVRANGEIHPGDVSYAVDVHNSGPWDTGRPYPYLRQGLANWRGTAGSRIVNSVRRHTRGGVGPVTNPNDIPF